MSSFEKNTFFQQLLPLTNQLRLLWSQELTHQWKETKTYLKALLSDYESFKEFTSSFGSEMSFARSSATLAYLDQQDRLGDNFSTFSEFSFVLALGFSTEELKSRNKRRLLSTLCRLDYILSKAVFSNEKTWEELSIFVEKDLQFLNEHKSELHPSMKLTLSKKADIKLRAA